MSNELRGHSDKGGGRRGRDPKRLLLKVLLAVFEFFEFQST